MNKNGFTFVEIMLVVLLLAIIAGLALPNFRQTYAGLKLKTASEDLANLMRYAQSRAVTRGHKIQLEFQEGFSGYLLKENVAVSPEKENYERIKGRFGRRFSFPVAIEAEASQNQIIFYPDGSIDKSYIVVCEPRKESACMTLSTKEQRGAVLIFKGRMDG